MIVARTAQHGARQLRPVLPPGLAPAVNLVEPAALVRALASLVAAPTSRSRQRLSPLQRAFRRELSIARTAQHGARKLRPVLPPRLAPPVDLAEVAAVVRALAVCIRALLLSRHPPRCLLP